MLPLWCVVKDYHWGRRGEKSLVARLAKVAVKDFEVIPDKTYAELWMGTHPSGESIISSKITSQEYADRKLSDVLKEEFGYAGNISIARTFGHDIPFLFKVLSIEQPLSIQSHPDKALAKILHQEDPGNYPDPNHKPEMAIALSEMEALCSFRPKNQLLAIFELFNEFEIIVGSQLLNDYKRSPGNDKNLLKEIFSKIMTADNILIKDTIESLEKKMLSPEFINNKGQLEDEVRTVFFKIRKFYPHDVGCLSQFLFNYVRLHPGEALYLAANEPHAYLEGECIEVMAKSDNVIRAGLTPKFKDVPRLCSSLSYKEYEAQELLVHPQPTDVITETYLTPAKEFAVDKIYFNSDGGFDHTYILPARGSGSILIVIKGGFALSTTNVKAQSGSVYFIPACLAVPLTFSESELLCFRAYVRE